jgi:hypothetical protein
MGHVPIAGHQAFWEDLSTRPRDVIWSRRVRSPILLHPP